jgi:hypothetical protein
VVLLDQHAGAEPQRHDDTRDEQQRQLRRLRRWRVPALVEYVVVGIVHAGHRQDVGHVGVGHVHLYS